MAVNGSRAVGYLETAFKERLGVAQAQGREKAAEAGLLRRTGKERQRKDFKQQRQQEYAQVKHIARIGAGGGPSPRTMGMPTIRGTAKGGGQAPRLGKRGGKKKTEGQRRAEEARGPSVFSAGGVAQLAGRRRWTAAGGQEDTSVDHSVFHKAQQVIDPYTPYNILKEKGKGVGPYKISAFAPGAATGGRRGQRGTGYGGPLGKGSTRGIREAKISQQRQLARKARLENYRLRIAPLHGEAATKRVLHEYNRRQIAMYGEDGQKGIGGNLLTNVLFRRGSLSPAKLWGDMERV